MADNNLCCVQLKQGCDKSAQKKQVVFQYGFAHHQNNGVEFVLFPMRIHASQEDLYRENPTRFVCNDACLLRRQQTGKDKSNSY